MRTFLAMVFAALVVASCSTTDVGVFDVEVGQCILIPQEAEAVQSLETVSCDEPHDGEIYELFDLDGDEYPGETAIGEQSTFGCLEAFEPFVGIDYQESLYYYTFLPPSLESWDGRDDREVICVLTAAPGRGQLTGSLEGIAE